MMKICLFVALIATLIMSSCADTTNNKLIIGKWMALDWTENGTSNPSKANNTFFSFDEKENYTLTHNGVVQKGTYKVENNQLFTRENGMMEMMVYISKLNTDTLILDMNNGGTPEKLILTRLRPK